MSRTLLSHGALRQSHLLSLPIWSAIGPVPMRRHTHGRNLETAPVGVTPASVRRAYQGFSFLPTSSAETAKSQTFFVTGRVSLPLGANSPVPLTSVIPLVTGWAGSDGQDCVLGVGPSKPYHPSVGVSPHCGLNNQGASPGGYHANARGVSRAPRRTSRPPLGALSSLAPGHATHSLRPFATSLPHPTPRPLS